MRTAVVALHLWHVEYLTILVHRGKWRVRRWVSGRRRPLKYVLKKLQDATLTLHRAFGLFRLGHLNDDRTGVVFGIFSLLRRKKVNPGRHTVVEKRY
ncbi:MAG: hypothetical protein UY52_C0024G0002 [Parcubacteria group bacterium GW2011_GWC2_49_9]|nr:MAG: hypothetical protein UY52_C0024G0002 [Parcubacteria group bacterium GW2011_GWC2_49_9]